MDSEKVSRYKQRRERRLNEDDKWVTLHPNGEESKGVRVPIDESGNVKTEWGKKSGLKLGGAKSKPVSELQKGKKNTPKSTESTSGKSATQSKSSLYKNVASGDVDIRSIFEPKIKKWGETPQEGVESFFSSMEPGDAVKVQFTGDDGNPVLGYFEKKPNGDIFLESTTGDIDEYFGGYPSGNVTAKKAAELYSEYMWQQSDGDSMYFEFVPKKEKEKPKEQAKPKEKAKPKGKSKNEPYKGDAPYYDVVDGITNISNIFAPQYKSKEDTPYYVVADFLRHMKPYDTVNVTYVGDDGLPITASFEKLSDKKIYMTSTSPEIIKKFGWDNARVVSNITAADLYTEYIWGKKRGKKLKVAFNKSNIEYKPLI